MTMGDDRSDDHLKIFKCLVDTGADVLRSTFERKVLNNNAITFEQYLDNVKHQFYHQFEKNRNKPCCSRSPHVNCNVNGYMDKKIFEKVYNKTSELDTHQCLDRFKVKGGVSTDELDLSDLNFFLWNSNMLSPQEKQSLQTIMTIRSNICHPESTQCYSITELESFWISLENDILLFAEPYRYKKMVTLQITTLKKYKINELESERIINEMATESEKIIREMKLEVQTRNDCTNQLMKEESVGIKNCIKDTYDKTTSFINENTQKLEENHKVLTTRCIEEIKTTVTEDGSNTRLHSEDQRRLIDSHLTESENRVCQTVVHSGGRLEDKLSEQTNEIRKHNVELNAVLKEKDRKLTMLTAEVMDVKTEIKELKTILFDHVRKQKVELVMNTEEMQRSKEYPDNRKVEMTLKVKQTHVTEDKENEIIENLPPEVEIQSHNDCLSEEAVTETIEITGKRVNSIILELKATPGILHSVDTFKAAILRLVQVMQTAGGIDVDIEDTVTVNLQFESPLTEDQFSVVNCIFAKEWNDDNTTEQLPDEYLSTSNEYSFTSVEYSSTSDEYSSMSDEYVSTEDVNEMEFRPELDTYSQKETSEVFQPEDTEHLTKTFCQLCVYKDRIIKALYEQNAIYVEINKRNMTNLQAEKNNQLDLKTKNTMMKGASSKQYLYECRNCYEKNDMIFQLDRRLCEIRRRILEVKGQSFDILSSTNVFEGLLKLTPQNTDVEEKKNMIYKELQSDISSQKLELIYDSDGQKSKMKPMELQPKTFQGAGLDQPHDKSNFSRTVLKLRSEYANNSYTILEGQKGLAIIVQQDDLTRVLGKIFRKTRDHPLNRLQDFFEEMELVVKCIEGSFNEKWHTEIPAEDFYCVFLVLLSPVNTESIRRILQSRCPGTPMIVMTGSARGSHCFGEIAEEPDTLIVSMFNSIRASVRDPSEKNIFEHFMEVSRLNRCADIMDILTRMNALYDDPIITFQSSLRKKFYFSNPTPTNILEHQRMLLNETFGRFLRKQ